MECEKCKKEHDGSFGSGRFCSRKCSSSRVWSNEINEKRSASVKKYISEHEELFKRMTSKEQLEKFLEGNKKYKERLNKELLESNYDDLKYTRLKKRISLEQENKCNVCKIDSWNGKKIILELEHKNGNHHDNSRENLECLCPNCHSQTEFWRGRNVADRKRRTISDDELFDAFLEEGNIRKTLLRFGLAAKGANYGRIKRILSLRGINYSRAHSDNGNLPDF